MNRVKHDPTCQADLGQAVLAGVTEGFGIGAKEAGRSFWAIAHGGLAGEEAGKLATTFARNAAFLPSTTTLELVTGGTEVDWGHWYFNFAYEGFKFVPGIGAGLDLGEAMYSCAIR